jgi:hypothetical protein
MSSVECVLLPLVSTACDGPLFDAPLSWRRDLVEVLDSLLSHDSESPTVFKSMRSIRRVSRE